MPGNFGESTLKTNLSVAAVAVTAAMTTVALLQLTACATVTEKTTGWLSSNADVIALVDGRILRGEANFAREREATFQLQTSAATIPSLSCFGRLRYTATSSGVVDLACSDGRTFNLVFAPLSPVSGVARDATGGTGNSGFTLTYGLSSEKAAGYLAVPLERLVPAKPPYVAPGGGASLG